MLTSTLSSSSFQDFVKPSVDSTASLSSSFASEETSIGSDFDSLSTISDSTYDLDTLVAKLNDLLADGFQDHMFDAVTDLLERYDSSLGDWKKYAYFDEGRYTRNLVATDQKTYTLILLCWAKGQGSPVHDHPCDGCFVRVVDGAIRETRYENKIGCGTLREISCKQFQEGQVTYITDDLGLHKMENPNSDKETVTLHLYTPPFQSCKRIDAETGDVVCSGKICYFSEYGVKCE
eukprot:GILI01004661.1.p1 GENE.GILI01004661.1~~GILI01004661.1.p1  ORF type:complete len:234 (+),score=37.46 GILI01004661.1:63-764(+)